jgi:hypothetical protein
MKLIIQGQRIAATATDDYQGDELVVDAPPDFAPQYLEDYTYREGALSPLVDVVWERIKRIRVRKGQEGGYQVAGHWYHSDLKSQAQQLGLARKADRIEAAGGDMSVPFQGPGPDGILLWKTMAGAWVPMTPMLAQQIFDAAEAQDMALFARAEQLRAMLKASLTPAAIDIEAGWPATFGDV